MRESQEGKKSGAKMATNHGGQAGKGDKKNNGETKEEQKKDLILKMETTNRDGDENES